MATTDEARRALLQQQARSVPQRVPATTVSQQASTSVPQRVPGVSPIATQGPALQSVPGQSPVFTQGRPAVSVPQRVAAPQGIGAFNNMPSQAEALRTGPQVTGAPQRVPVSPMPQPVNTATAGDATTRIGQRLANISGEPYRDPRSVFNRPINMKPAADMAGNVAGKVGNAAKTAGKALIPSAKNLTRAGIGLGGLVEASRTGFDMLTPGMNDLDKTARVAEGAGRFGLATAGGLKGAAAGGALGAMTGPLAPVLAPAGAVVGGIAGGLAGAYAPEMLNSAVNKVSGFFGGPDQNQLASQKAADLRAKNGMPPPGQSTSTKVAAVMPSDGAEKMPDKNAWLDTAQIESLPISEEEAANLTAEKNARLAAKEAYRQPAPGSPRSTARKEPPGKMAQNNPTVGAVPRAESTPPTASELQGIGANPLDGVMFTSLGDAETGRVGARVYMKDGSIIEGRKAMEIMDAADVAQGIAQGRPDGAVEIIRGPAVTMQQAMGIEPHSGLGISRGMAVPEMGYAEMEVPQFSALSANGGIGNFTQAMAQGLVDGAAPEQAKLRSALEQQALQNQGSATNAAISAGPGYARVAEDRRQFGQTRQDGIDGIGKGGVDPRNFITVGGGQEIVQDANGLSTTITRPTRLYNAATQQWIDASSGMEAVGNYEVGKVYTDAQGNKAIWDGKKFAPAPK